MALFVCKHCGKADFKTERGLNQHLDKSRTCNPEARELRAALAHHHGQNGDEDSQNDDMMIADMEVNEVEVGSDADISAMNLDGSSDEEDEGFAWNVADNDDMSMVDIIAFQDNNSWGRGDSAGNTVPLATPVGNDGEALREFC